MKFFTPVRMLVIGGTLVVLSVILPLLMVVKVLESTFFLNFFSYIIGVIGTILGLTGAALYVRINRRK